MSRPGHRCLDCGEPCSCVSAEGECFHVCRLYPDVADELWADDADEDYR